MNKIKIDNNNVCIFCNHSFASPPSLSRHRKVCQEKINMKTEYETEKANMKKIHEEEIRKLNIVIDNQTMVFQKEKKHLEKESKKQQTMLTNEHSNVEKVQQENRDLKE